MEKYLQKNRGKFIIAFLIVAGVVCILFSGSLRTNTIPSDTSITVQTKHSELRKAQLDPKKSWGDNVKTMFPDITKPEYVSADKAGSFLDDKDPVLVLKTDNATYVYPLSIMSFHHIVNDTIDKEPVAITYCLLADTAETFSRTHEGKTLEFGVLGPLYAGNLVMYDKSTDASFLQLNGQGFNGMYKDQLLNQYKPLSRQIWQDVKDTENIKVLAPVKEMKFYSDFYNKMKGAEVGLNSVTSKNIPLDVRNKPFTKGIGIIKGTEITFVPLDMQSQYVSRIREADFSTQVYWYTWSSIFPSTRIITQ